MNILIVNGSPRGAKSNSMKLTEAFIHGMEEILTIHTDILTISQLDIKPCIGCFSCWKNTPGKCCISDDMAMIIENYYRRCCCIQLSTLLFRTAFSVKSAD